jgi:hypothetical protein
MRIVVLGVAATTLLAVGVPGAAADGDPASDVLYFQDVYVPYTRPSKVATDDLFRSVQAARSQRYAIKVAVIASRVDLGAVPSLFGRPQPYAEFLGQELKSFYTGPLLIVMRAGLGFWKGGADTRDESRVLGEVTVHGDTVDELMHTGAAAVRRLAGIADSPGPADVRSPHVRALAASVKRGKSVKLRYRVSDNSGRSREVVRVYGKNLFLYANVVSPMERARGGVDSVRWRAPRHLDERRLRFCVLARDPAGNASRTACAPLRVR